MKTKSDITPEELNQNSKYQLVKELPFSDIKPFIIQLFTNGNRWLKAYSIYQTISLLGLMLFAGYHIAKAFWGDNYDTAFLSALFLGVLFSFTALIVLHELIHAFAYWSIGKRKLKFGANPAKFMFYVHAHMQVVNRPEFMYVALLPFVAVHIISLPIIIAFSGTPVSIFSLVVLLTHNLFCAGDFALLSFFYKYKSDQFYTYDDSINKLARFYTGPAEKH